MAATVTLSSVGTSNPLILDYIGAKGTTAQITPTSTSMTFDATLQATLDSSAQGVDPPIWAALSSAHYSGEATVPIATPIAGLRISSTAISSSSVRLKVLQNAGG